MDEGKERKEPKLIEVFKDYEIKLESRFNMGNAMRISTYAIEKKEKPERITRKKLMKYAEALAKRYPKEGFALVEKRISEKVVERVGDKDVEKTVKRKFYVLTKKGKNPEKPTINIWFRLREQKVFIEEEATKNPRLTNFIIMRTLGSLGFIKNKYVSSQIVRQGETHEPA